MGSTFGSFEIGRRALHAQQKGAQVTGQNIANANTEGYSRQLVLMKALVPPAAPGVETPPGYGVAISDIRRIKSEFYGDQIMKSTTSQNYWKRVRETLDGIEIIFQEPEETGINTALNEFFDAWQDLSVNPESHAVRLSLREQAEALTGLVRDIYGRLDELKFDVRKELQATLTQINTLAAEIADLNKKITYLQALGQKSNELLDQRDLCLQELSKHVNIRVNEKVGGSLEVLAGGCILLHDDRHFDLEISEEGGKLAVCNEIGAELSIREGDGAIAGLLDSYNTIFPRYQGALNELVFNLVQKVNDLHKNGYGLDGSTTGIDFFTDIEEQNANTAALHFSISDAIKDDLNKIAAASQADHPGDGSNALKIAQLREKLVMGGPPGDETTTFHDYFRGVMADLGVEGREAERMSLAMERVMESLQEKQESISGVSLDDEMLNLVQYQHAYNAAARFLNVLDEMLGVLFSEIGS
ncbi:MAG TPA: flagellar hook-associated protein FlgK [Firmicutes bacterium]|jgi:flagellar hook-associated protein 1 FlgK|nr:flagellar hook-associated protein FlgK [Bacillota bacterium]